MLSCRTDVSVEDVEWVRCTGDDADQAVDDDDMQL